MFYILIYKPLFLIKILLIKTNTDFFFFFMFSFTAIPSDQHLSSNKVLAYVGLVLTFQHRTPVPSLGSILSERCPLISASVFESIWLHRATYIQVGGVQQWPHFVTLAVCPADFNQQISELTPQALKLHKMSFTWESITNEGLQSLLTEQAPVMFP